MIDRRARAAAAMVVALGAMALTRPARAQQDPPRDTSSPASTPLALRPSKPLDLAREPAHTGAGWTIVSVLAVVGGAAYYLRRRAQPRRVEDAQLIVVRRAPLGFRSELVVVNVEGQRLLVGVTPHSMQTLAVLDGDEAHAAAAAGASDPAPSSPGLGQRFAEMLKAADAAPAGRRAESEPPAEQSSVAGQARGLLALRRRG
ncbi:MAG TPA: flagellar biosynthetic protein FliO [Polyangiaceae bacterium]|nr:flagellar biosynthetic protein FliO [Polyangiaceae bacterium]